MKRRKMVFVALSVLVVLIAGSFASAADAPQLKITQVPVFTQWWSYLYGTVTGVAPGDYWIAPLLYVPGLGWYSKPYDRDYPPYARIVSIRDDGSWYTQMQTGGIDNLATIIAVYLIPKSSYPACYPFVAGAQCVPESLKAAAVASDRALTSQQRKISWSGQDWYVKTSQSDNHSGKVGPGSNFFSDSTDNVWVDDNDKLHLKINYSNDRWNCAEIASATRLGYGTYRFYIDSRLDNLDRAATLGLFTWSDIAPVTGNREIDLEFTTWNDSILPNNAQYVVQPYIVEGNMLRYPMTSAVPSIHSFTWEPGKISFSSTDESGSPINSWDFVKTESIPKSADERIHMNLWVNNGSGPSSGQPVEMVISKFEFTPWDDPAHPTFYLNGRAASANLTRQVSGKYKFKLSGKVIAKDTEGLVLDDGSPTPLRVLDPGHTFEIGNFLTVEGFLNPDAPKQLDTSSGRIMPLDQN